MNHVILFTHFLPSSHHPPAAQTFRGTMSVYQQVDKNYLQDTFIKLAQVDSAAKPVTENFPSTEGQKTMAYLVKKELEKIEGLQDIVVDEHFVVTATLPGNHPKTKDLAIGLLAHLDTSWDMNTSEIHPQIHQRYQGKDLKLSHGDTIPASALKKFKGEDIITSDGRTLLGADDKAGIVEILESLRLFQRNPHLKHPTIKVAFTPDEENGLFLVHTPLKNFKVNYAYTLDGTYFNHLDTDTINTNRIEITIRGVSSHSHGAKGRKVNAVIVANQLIKKIPLSQMPETTTDDEGYYHVPLLKGNQREIKMRVIVADRDYNNMIEKQKRVLKWIHQIQKQFPQSTIRVEIVPRLRNIQEQVQDSYEVIDIAKKGIQETIKQVQSKEKVKIAPFRAGTDGVFLTLQGIPTPNLPAGWQNAHSTREFVSVQEMARCTANIVNTLVLWADPASVLKGRKLSQVLSKAPSIRSE